MKNTVFLLLVAVCAPLMAPAADIPAAKDQIASTLIAAPEDRREKAAVLGYDSSGKLVTLREGSNDTICLADDPNTKGFSVACYHKDLEPFMARGRELTVQGMKGEERHKLRAKEVEEGKLPMPREARSMSVVTGKEYDPASGQIVEQYQRWVVYVPFATAETTGLPTKAADGVPWLMYPGQAGAHIMISPKREKKESSNP